MKIKIDDEVIIKDESQPIKGTPEDPYTVESIRDGAAKLSFHGNNGDLRMFGPLVTLSRLKVTKPRTTRSELKQQIAELTSKLSGYENAPVVVVDIDELCNATIEARTEEIKSQLEKAQKENTKRISQSVADAEQIRGLQQQLNEASCINLETLGKLADAQQATRILQALEKMGTHCELFHRQGSLNPWCIFRGSYDLIGEGNTINEAVVAAGLLTETEESNADTKD